MMRTRRFAALTATGVLVLGLLAAGAAQASYILELDGQIRGGPNDSFIGDGIYNDTADGQTKVRRVRPGMGDRFRVRVENDGYDYDEYMVTGDASSGRFRVSYYEEVETLGPLAGDVSNNWIDVTDMVTSGNYTTDCIDGPDDYEDLLVYIQAGPNAALGASKTANVTFTSSGGGCNNEAPQPAGGKGYTTDTVAARLVVGGNSGDDGGKAPRTP